MTQLPEKDHTNKAWMGMGCFMIPIILFVLVVTIYIVRFVYSLFNMPAY